MLKLIVFAVVICSSHSAGHPLQKHSSGKKNAPFAGTRTDMDTSFRDGTDFLWSGTEPFWSIKIDFMKSMHFKMADGYEITVPASPVTRAMDADVTRYHSVSEQGTLTVQIDHFSCMNEMSGKKSDYAVNVNLQ